MIFDHIRDQMKDVRNTMSEEPAEINGKLWNLLDFLDNKKSPVGVLDIAKSLELSLSEIDEMVKVMESLCYDYVMKEIEGKNYIINTAEEKMRQKAYIESKVSNSEKINDQYLLKKLHPNEFSKVEIILETLNKKFALQVELNGKEVQFYLHRFLYLEGKLAIIVEDLKEKSLLHFEIENIGIIKAIELAEYVPNYGPLEVEDLINSIRAVSDDAVRLVLKLKKGENFKVTPDYYYLGDPYVTSNFDGDLIWAATLEPSNDLYEYLYPVRDSVEILDPLKIKREFLKFCTKKLEKEIKNLKKVS